MTTSLGEFPKQTLITARARVKCGSCPSTSECVARAGSARWRTMSMTEAVGGVTPIRKRNPQVKAEAGRPGRSCHWSVPPPVDGGPTVGLTVYDADWLVVGGLRAAASLAQGASFTNRSGSRNGSRDRYKTWSGFSVPEPAHTHEALPPAAGHPFS